MKAVWATDLAPAEDIRWARAELSMLAGSQAVHPLTDDEQARRDLRHRQERRVLGGPELPDRA